MKKYKSNEELIKYLISKNVVVNNEQDAINKIERYTYYSVVNSYKNNFNKKKEVGVKESLLGDKVLIEAVV